MEQKGNIIISDQSALYALLHADLHEHIRSNRASRNPLLDCAQTKEGLTAFNGNHPLYGTKPITLLAGSSLKRRKADGVICRCVEAEVPASSFFKLRDGLYMAGPELVFVRMASFVNTNKLIEIGINLCARYFISPTADSILDRGGYLTTPKRLASFATQSTIRGSRKAANAARFIIANSGSPLESKMAMQFCGPLSRGGFALPFTHMNYDVHAGRSAGITTQGFYSIDLANPERACGLEYDGADYHQDASKDKRRRNELLALGWDIFPIDKSVLFDPRETEKAARQIAKHLHMRIRKPACWEKKYAELREDLGLPYRSPVQFNDC